MWTLSRMRHFKSELLPAPSTAASLSNVSITHASFAELAAAAGPPITAFALSGNNPTMLERLRRTWGIRNLMIGAAFVSLCLLGGAVFAVIDAWTPPGKW